MQRQVFSLTIVVVLVHAGAAPVDAQELAGTFDQLRVLVKPGDKITVTGDTVRETSGRIAERPFVTPQRTGGLAAVGF